MKFASLVFSLALAAFVPSAQAATAGKEASAKAAANFVRGAPLPKWAMPLAPIPATKRDDTVVVRLADTQAWVGPTPAVLFNSAVQVNGKSALDGIGQFGISFVPAYQKLYLHRVAILRGADVLDRTATVNTRLLERETGLERGMYGGATTVQLLLEDVRVGDTLWLTYTVEGENPVFGKMWSGSFSWDSSAPTELRRVTILHPRNRPVHWRLLGDFKPAPVTPVVEQIGALERITFTDTGVAGLEPEPATPSDYISHRLLQLTEYDSWKDVAAWGSSLFPQVAASAATTDLVRQFSKQGDAAARASAALHWVQDEIRYFSVSMGENSHRPQAPDVVLKRRYGDCKDKSYLLVSLLSQMGIKATPVLVNASAFQLPSKVLPSPAWFDHVIVRVELDGEAYFVDPTRSSEKGAIAALPTALGGAAGLPADRSAGQLMTIPESTLTAPHVERFEKITVDAFDGDGTLEMRKVYRRNHAAAMRQAYQSMSGAELRTATLSQYEKQYPGITLTGAPALQDAEDGTAFEVRATFKLSKPVQHKDGTYRIEFDSKLVDDTLGIPPKLVRNFPFEFPMGRFKSRYQLDVYWPKGVREMIVPGPESFDTPFFTLRDEYAMRGNRFSYSADYHIKNKSIEAAQLPELQVQSKKLVHELKVIASVRESEVVSEEERSFSLRELELPRMADMMGTLLPLFDKKKSEDVDLAAICDFVVHMASIAESMPGGGVVGAGLAADLKRQESRPGYRKCRGRLLYSHGEYAASLPLFEAEAPLEEGDRLRKALAWAHFYTGDKPAALAQLRRFYAARKQSDTLAVIDQVDVLALLQRLGEPAPPELAAGAGFAAQAWPYPLLAMQTGALTFDQLMDKVEVLPGDERELAANEANFYVAQNQLARDDKRGALETLRWFAAHGLRTTVISRQAASEVWRQEYSDAELQAAVAAEDKKDFALARKLYTQAAERGVPMARYRLGLLHYYGKGGAYPNYQLAVRSFYQASEDGVPAAMNFMGVIYAQGYLGPVNEEKAIEWYKTAARFGEIDASWNLGSRYLNGSSGLYQDFAKAYSYLKEAAELGNGDAQAALAQMYTEGLGLPRDYAKARYWARLSMWRGNDSGVLRFGILALDGHGVAKDPALAVKLFKACSKAGTADCTHALARAYQAGTGADKDESKALSLLKQAAREGSAMAQLILAERLLKGEGLSADPVEARKWLKRAANQGQQPAFDYLDSFGEKDMQAKADAEAAFELGRFFYLGARNHAHHVLAAKWYQKAAALGSYPALNSVGDMYENGLVLPKDLDKALECYRKSAAQGVGIAFASLGSLYEHGRGVPKDARLAFAYYQLAMRMKYPLTKERLDGVAELLAPDEKAQAERIASAWNNALPLPQ